MIGSDWSRVDKTQFDAALANMEFTTRTAWTQGGKALVDSFYVSGELVAQQHCCEGNVSYHLNDGALADVECQSQLEAANG